MDKERRAPVSMSEPRRIIYQMDPQALARYLCELGTSITRLGEENRQMREALEAIASSESPQEDAQEMIFTAAHALTQEEPKDGEEG